MTINTAITEVQAICPHAYPDETVTRWLSELDGKLREEVVKDTSEPVKYIWPEDADTSLLADHPHDDIYPAYILAMVDLCNRDTVRYANDMQVFNQKKEDYACWYRRTHKSASYSGWITL